MGDMDQDECGPVEGRTCVVCGEPAWYDLSSLSRESGPELWVCPDHVQSPEWLELSLAWREVGRAILTESLLARIAYRCLEWLAAAYGRIRSTRECP